jgi:hypothetical protein
VHSTPGPAPSFSQGTWAGGRPVCGVTGGHLENAATRDRRAKSGSALDPGSVVLMISLGACATAPSRSFSKSPDDTCSCQTGECGRRPASDYADCIASKMLYPALFVKRFRSGFLGRSWSRAHWPDSADQPCRPAACAAASASGSAAGDPSGVEAVSGDVRECLVERRGARHQASGCSQKPGAVSRCPARPAPDRWARRRILFGGGASAASAALAVRVGVLVLVDVPGAGRGRPSRPASRGRRR